MSRAPRLLKLATYSLNTSVRGGMKAIKFVLVDRTLACDAHSLIHGIFLTTLLSFPFRTYNRIQLNEMRKKISELETRNDETP